MNKYFFTLIELLVVIAVIAVLAAMLLPSLNKARLKARITSCANIEKQMGTGFMLYLSDHDDFYPKTNVDDPASGILPIPTSGFALEWYDTVLPYVSASETIMENSHAKSNYPFLVCPISNKRFLAKNNDGSYATEKWGSYGYNTRFSGQKTTKFKRTSASAIMMDSKFYAFHNHQNFLLRYIADSAHSNQGFPLGDVNILFADGHVEGQFMSTVLGSGPYLTSDSGYNRKYLVLLDPTKSI